MIFKYYRSPVNLKISSGFETSLYLRSLAKVSVILAALHKSHVVSKIFSKWVPRR